MAWAPHLPFEAVRAFAVHDPAKLHAEDRWSHFVVAENDGDILGLLETTSDTVDSLHVDDRHWGQGLGTLLLDEGERRIQATSAIARLEVRAFNARAIRFYLDRGWREARRYPSFECGASVETVEMTKSL